MSKATGKARHPHDASRPIPASVRKALEKQDIKALKIALTPRQRAFANEYVVDFNATAATIRAGYATKHADKQAYILLQHEGVAALIDHLTLSKEAKVTAIDPDYVLSKVTEIISKESAKDGDKLRGLELLARHLGMFVDRTEISGPDGKEIEIKKREIKERSDDFLNLIDRTAKKGDLKLVESK